MEIDHYSDEYDNAPMPYSIFFTQTGNAIHGTHEQRNLGRAVSHGCVRLSVKNAATLWALVKQEKMANTKVVLNGAIPGTAPVARSGPLQLTPEAPPATLSHNRSINRSTTIDRRCRTRFPCLDANRSAACLKPERAKGD